ncbi:hypothetical protein [Brochothrix thermosphacta]|uniref:hypothetical protein n=1 Tax=Brochothrix thermosphacta TaxID=2756 RepID=UPI0039B113FD
MLIIWKFFGEVLVASSSDSNMTSVGNVTLIQRSSPLGNGVLGSVLSIFPKLPRVLTSAEIYFK